LVKAAVTGMLIMLGALSCAHAELTIQEKDPGASITNRYALLLDADPTSVELHQLVADLNQRVTNNPKDALAWEILAQIYDHNGYELYALYAASEAIEQGSSTSKLEKILLDNSASVAEQQLRSGYLSPDVDAEFFQEYQFAISKMYGDVYGFNYDESLPKPPVVRARVKKRAVKRRNTSSSRRSSTRKPRTVRTTAATPRRRTPAKPRARVKPPVVRPKSQARRPVAKPAASQRRSSSGDPFKILR